MYTSHSHLCSTKSITNHSRHFLSTTKVSFHRHKISSNQNTTPYTYDPLSTHTHTKHPFALLNKILNNRNSFYPLSSIHLCKQTKFKGIGDQKSLSCTAIILLHFELHRVKIVLNQQNNLKFCVKNCKVKPFNNTKNQTGLRKVWNYSSSTNNLHLISTTADSCSKFAKVNFETPHNLNHFILFYRTKSFVNYRAVNTNQLNWDMSRPAHFDLDALEDLIDQESVHSADLSDISGTSDTIGDISGDLEYLSVSSNNINEAIKEAE